MKTGGSNACPGGRSFGEIDDPARMLFLVSLIERGQIGQERGGLRNAGPCCIKHAHKIAWFYAGWLEES